ncbi:MAG: PQQ-binding-like beta-propeller repeat protein [Acidobacteria bacterium]|nr:PQQ-binding-like beta-propeller repeat protein [Acidobacteriota bacterium]
MFKLIQKMFLMAMAMHIHLSAPFAFTTYLAEPQDQPIIGEIDDPYRICGIYAPETPISGDLILNSDSLIFADHGGTISAVDTGSRTLAWKAELGGNTASNLLRTGDHIYVVTNSTGGNGSDTKTSHLREINPATGLPSKSVSLSYADRFYLLTSDVGPVIIGDAGFIYLMTSDSPEGLLRKDLPFNGPLQSAISEDVLWVLNASGVFATISLSERKILTQGSLGKEIRAITANASHGVFVADNSGGISKISSSDGKSSWNFKAGAAVTGIHISKDEIFLTSLDNFVYKLSAGSGDVVWRRRVPNRIAIPASVAETSIYVSGIGDEEIFLIDRARGTILNRLPLGANMNVASPIILLGNGGLAVPVSSSIIFYGEGVCN